MLLIALIITRSQRVCCHCQCLGRQPDYINDIFLYINYIISINIHKYAPHCPYHHPLTEGVLSLSMLRQAT